MPQISLNIHLTREDVIKNGSIFTGPEIVKLVYDQLKPFINKDSVIGDFGAGYGAFLEKFRKSGKRCFGTELEDLSYMLLKNEYPELDIYHENSLVDISREKYNLKEDDELIAVGNPPYNDVTSIYRKGQKGELVCDADIVSRDFGISFLKAYNKLEAKYICVLHPLAYLIKKQNFNALGAFKDNYRLLKGTVFSSKEFESIKKTNSEFPVVAALYERCDDGMDYEHIRAFRFSILGSKAGFVLKDILTIDGIVDKYPKAGKTAGLQFYTLRDMNALLRNAGFVENRKTNGLEVTGGNLYQYAWLYFLKNNFAPAKNRFLYGNLSPLWTKRLEEDSFKNQAVTYAYNNCELIRKYYTADQIKALYGPAAEDQSELFSELEKLYIF